MPIGIRAAGEKIALVPSGPSVLCVEHVVFSDCNTLLSIVKKKLVDPASTRAREALFHPTFSSIIGVKDYRLHAATVPPRFTFRQLVAGCRSDRLHSTFPSDRPSV